MCGIAGKFNFGDRAPVPTALLDRMNLVQQHRGPDGAGIYNSGAVGLAHRRLSILDLAGGHQPMSNEDGTVWIVFNGEIYNYPELRPQLEARGHVFRTHSDTEAIVHLYEDRGEDCVQELRGMFAFAIWDARHETLFLSRDRLGIKPLHYAVPRGASLVFGSEIKAVLQDESVRRTVNREALEQYLGLLYVPAPATMFSGIQKLPAGHMLRCNRHGVQIRRYWDLSYRVNEELTEAAATEQFAALLRETVRSHLLSDVPLGAFLSGGLDSSAVVAFMKQVMRGQLVTLSIGFRESEYNELPYARAVAGAVGSVHHERIVDSDINDLLPRLVWAFDEPFADSSAVPTYHVSQQAREHVTVALSGDGGDELFAGYRRHAVEGQEQQWRNRLGPLRHAAGIVRHLPADWKFTGRYSLECLGMDAASAYARKHTNYVMPPVARSQLLVETSAADPVSSHRELYRQAPAAPGDWLNRSLYVDMKTYLVDDILTKVDRMSMAVSLETRPPLLDHKLVEFVATLPPHLKLHRGTSKYLLRQVAAPHVPAAVLSRHKQGFRLPVADWMRDPLRPLAGDLLFGPTARSRGYFRPAAVQAIWDQHQSSQRDHAHRLWLLMMWELWHRKYIDAATAPTAE